MITYDIDIDFRIISTISTSSKLSTNHSELRASAHSAPNILDKHLENLQAWGLIQDKKPSSNGLPRKITLLEPYDYCLSQLTELKTAIDKVNYFFGQTALNKNE